MRLDRLSAARPRPPRSVSTRIITGKETRAARWSWRGLSSQPAEVPASFNAEPIKACRRGRGVIAESQHASRAGQRRQCAPIHLVQRRFILNRVGKAVPGRKGKFERRSRPIHAGNRGRSAAIGGDGAVVDHCPDNRAAAREHRVFRDDQPVGK